MDHKPSPRKLMRSSRKYSSPAATYTFVTGALSMKPGLMVAEPFNRPLPA